MKMKTPKRLFLITTLAIFTLALQTQVFANDKTSQEEQPAKVNFKEWVGPYLQPLFFTYERKALLEALTYASEVISIKSMDSVDPTTIEIAACLSGLINLVRLTDDVSRFGPAAAVIDGLLANKDLFEKWPNSKKIAAYNYANRRDLSKEKKSQLLQLSLLELPRTALFLTMAFIMKKAEKLTSENDQGISINEIEERDDIKRLIKILAVTGAFSWLCYTFDTIRKFKRYQLEMPADLVKTLTPHPLGRGNISQNSTCA